MNPAETLHGAKQKRNVSDSDYLSTVDVRLLSGY